MQLINGANVYLNFTAEEYDKKIDRIKKERQSIVDIKTMRMEIKKVKLEYKEKKEEAERSQNILNEEMEKEIKKLENELKIKGLDNNEIKAKVSELRDYVNKMTKSRKRVVESLMDKVQEKLIKNYSDSTRKMYEFIDEMLDKKEKEEAGEELEDKYKNVGDIDEYLYRYLDLETRRIFENTRALPDKQRLRRILIDELKKEKMGFSDRVNEVIYGNKTTGKKGLKSLDYEEYVQYTKYKYQNDCIPKAVYKTVQEIADSLVKTGVIRDKFYSSKIREKVKDSKVLERMVTPERPEEEYEAYKEKIGISNKVKLVRIRERNKVLRKPRILKDKTRFLSDALSKKRNKNDLFKDVYSYTQRQGERFAIACEELYYSIETVIREKVENALKENYIVRDYLPEEQNEQFNKIRQEINQRVEAKKQTSTETLENLKERVKIEYIEELVEKERTNFEKKIAEEIAIKYLAGMTDGSIKRKMIKIGNVSRMKFYMQNKPINRTNKEIARLTNIMTGKIPEER